MKLLMTGKSVLCKQTNPHEHKIWEIVANLQGSGTFTYDDDKSVPFSPGTIVCIPPSVSHSKQSENGYRDLWIWTEDLFCRIVTRRSFFRRPATTALFP